MNYFFSAGEHSGDLHAAALIRAVRRQDPAAEIWGMGGPLMAEAGAEIIIDPTRESTFGYLEAAKKYLVFKKYLKQLTRLLKERRPDVMVWVDFGGFNLLLAEQAAALSIPVVCLFPPSAWAYSKGRAARVAGCVTHIASVLPFEADFYREYGVKVTYVGHPLIDRVKPTVEPERWRRSHHVSKEEKVVLLMPGSRRQEVRQLLPVMLEAISQMAAVDRQLRFFLPVAPTIGRELIGPYLSSYPGLVSTVDSSEVYNVMAAAELGILASGTATLEAALLGMPMIVIYRLGRASAFLFKILMNEEKREEPLMVALPNLIKRRRVVPELIQHELTTENLVAQFRLLLETEGLRAEMRNELKELPSLLGPPGIMERVATIVLGEAVQKR